MDVKNDEAIEVTKRFLREAAIEKLPSLISKKISLRKDNVYLKTLFDNGIVIEDLHELEERYWYVTMLTGLLPNLRKLWHSKNFYTRASDSSIHGDNVLFLPITGKYYWGNYEVSKHDKFAMINYNTEGNNFILRRIRDKIVYIPELDIWLGKFCYDDTSAEPAFMGYFSLAHS